VLQGGFARGQRVVLRAPKEPELAGLEGAVGTLREWLEEEARWQVDVDGSLTAVAAEHLRLEASSGDEGDEDVLLENEEDVDGDAWRGRQRVTHPAVGDLLQARHKGSWVDAVVVEYPLGAAAGAGEDCEEAEEAYAPESPAGLQQEPKDRPPASPNAMVRVVLLASCLEALVVIARLRRKENHLVHRRRLEACDLARKKLRSGARISDQDVLDVLRIWAFLPNGVRKNVIPTGENWVYSDTIGLVRSRCQSECVASRATLDYPDIMRLLSRWARDSGTRIKGCLFPFTSISLNFAYGARVHRDRHNAGPSLLRALGAFSGGQLGYFPDDDGTMRVEELPMNKRVKLDTQADWRIIDGTRAHCVEPFDGERFSVVFFTCGHYQRVSEKVQQALKAAGAVWPRPQILRPLKRQLGDPQGYKRPKSGSSLKAGPPPSKRQRRDSNDAFSDSCAEEAMPEPLQVQSHAADELEKAPAQDAAPTSTGEKYKLVDFPHLALALQLNAIYSTGTLVKRCKGNLLMLTALRRKLQDPNIFEPVHEEPASTSTPLREETPASQPKLPEKCGERRQPRQRMPAVAPRRAQASPSSAGRKTAPKKSLSKTTKSAMYRLKGHPHLSLNLRKGRLYSEEALVKGCNGDHSKLASLRKKLKDPEVFQLVRE
jgi:hypothetical protein